MRKRLRHWCQRAEPCAWTPLTCGGTQARERTTGWKYWLIVFPFVLGAADDDGERFSEAGSGMPLGCLCGQTRAVSEWLSAELHLLGE